MIASDIQMCNLYFSIQKDFRLVKEFEGQVKRSRASRFTRTNNLEKSAT